MVNHRLTFTHTRPDVPGPICVVCGKEVDAEMWAGGERCPEDAVELATKELKG